MADCRFRCYGKRVDPRFVQLSRTAASICLSFVRMRTTLSPHPFSRSSRDSVSLLRAQVSDFRLTRALDARALLYIPCPPSHDVTLGSPRKNHRHNGC